MLQKTGMTFLANPIISCFEMTVQQLKITEPLGMEMGFPCGSAGKESASNSGDVWVGKILCRRERLTTPVSWPGEFHGQCSPRGREELDTTE